MLEQALLCVLCFNISFTKLPARMRTLNGIGELTLVGRTTYWKLQMTLVLFNNHVLQFLSINLMIIKLLSCKSNLFCDNLVGDHAYTLAISEALLQIPPSPCTSQRTLLAFSIAVNEMSWCSEWSVHGLWEMLSLASFLVLVVLTIFSAW